MKRHLFTPVVTLMVLTALTTAADARAEGDRERVLQRGTDSATGAEVTVARGDAGLIAINVQAPDLRLRKELVAGRMVTSVRTPGDELTIEFDRRTFIVTGGGRRVEVTPDHPDRIEAARSIIAHSTAAARGATLLGRMGVGPDAPMRVLLLSTRVLLQAGEPDESTKADASRWVESARTRARAGITRVAIQDGPGDCWAKYAAEAIAAYMEYEDCMANVRWYDLLGAPACAIIYDMRAIGAFSWWIGCVSFNA
jgi:hypothetical protein